jgi:hypothetical protein
MWAASFYLDAISTPAGPVMGSHPNVEMKQGSRPSRPHVWASDQS